MSRLSQPGTQIAADAVEQANEVIQAKSKYSFFFKETGQTRQERTLDIFRALQKYRAPGSLEEYWGHLLDQARRLRQVEFGDELAEMRQEISTMQRTVNLINEEFVTLKHTVEQLAVEVHARDTSEQPKPGVNVEAYKSYVEAVSGLDELRQILLSEGEEVTTVWTVIDAPPFEDSVRVPIYEAQLNVLSTLEDNVLLDFLIVNLSELSENEELQDIVPPTAKLVWER